MDHVVTLASFPGLLSSPGLHCRALPRLYLRLAVALHRLMYFARKLFLVLASPFKPFSLHVLTCRPCVQSGICLCLFWEKVGEFQDLCFVENLMGEVGGRLCAVSNVAGSCWKQLVLLSVDWLILVSDPLSCSV